MTSRRGKVEQPASAKTVRNAQLMLRKALRSAEQRGHVRRNVALQVPLRHVPRAHREALTPDMARRILAAVAGDRYEAAFALAFIGLREGEILGLAWQEVNLDAATAMVRYELYGVRRERHSPPAQDRGIRGDRPPAAIRRGPPPCAF